MVVTLPAGPPPAATRLGRALDSVEWAASVGPLRGLGFRLAVRVTEPLLGGHLGRILGSLADDTAEPEHLYSVVEPGPGSDRGTRLYLDDRRIAASPSPGLAVATLLWHLNRSAVASLPGHLLIHAAVVGTGGRAMLLPGRSGAGKTTLAAGLVGAGMGYLSDEVAAVDPTTLTVEPFPKPLTVKDGAWGVMAPLAAPAGDVPQRYRDGSWHVDPRDIRAGSIAGRCPPALIVFPRYQPGGSTELSPVGRAEALAQLATHTFNVPYSGQRGLSVLAAVVRQCRTFSLVVGDLDQACDVLGSL